MQPPDKATDLFLTEHSFTAFSLGRQFGNCHIVDKVRQETSLNNALDGVTKPLSNM